MEKQSSLGVKDYSVGHNPTVVGRSQAYADDSYYSKPYRQYQTCMVRNEEMLTNPNKIITNEA